VDPRRIAIVLARVLALLGLTVSAALVVEYASPVPLLCGPGGGCTAVRACGEQRVPWFSLPWFGLVSYGLALSASLLTPQDKAKRILPALGVGAALGGLTLLLVQRGLCGSFCKLCVITDASALLFGACLVYGRDSYEPASVAQRWLFGGGAVLAATAAMALAPTPSPTNPTDNGAPPQTIAVLPAPIAREQRAGVVTIVEFADFECPFCRRQHDVLTRALAPYGERVRFVRKQLPLNGIHPHAETAALAALCAEEQGRGEAMADKLFRADPERLTTEGTESLAGDVSVDLPRFRACVTSDRTRSHLAADRNAAGECGVNGLPTMFIGRERFDGAVSEEAVRASIERAFRADAGVTAEELSGGGDAGASETTERAADAGGASVDASATGG
jgi:protein-disulfide isomerase